MFVAVMVNRRSTCVCSHVLYPEAIHLEIVVNLTIDCFLTNDTPAGDLYQD